MNICDVYNIKYLYKTYGTCLCFTSKQRKKTTKHTAMSKAWFDKCGLVSLENDAAGYNSN